MVGLVWAKWLGFFFFFFLVFGGVARGVELVAYLMLIVVICSAQVLWHLLAASGSCDSLPRGCSKNGIGVEGAIEGTRLKLHQGPLFFLFLD